MPVSTLAATRARSLAAAEEILLAAEVEEIPLAAVVEEIPLAAERNLEGRRAEAHMLAAVGDRGLAGNSSLGFRLVENHGLDVELGSNGWLTAL